MPKLWGFAGDGINVSYVVAKKITA